MMTSNTKTGIAICYYNEDFKNRESYMQYYHNDDFKHKNRDSYIRYYHNDDFQHKNRERLYAILS